MGLGVAFKTGWKVWKALGKPDETPKTSDSAQPQPVPQAGPSRKPEKADKSNKTVIMLMGQEAVGKTTLLSLMYKEFSRNSRFQQFVAHDDTGIALEEAYQKLCTIIEQPNFTRPPRLLSGTAGVVEYSFDIDNRQFAVCDTAGGLIMKAKGEDFEDFKAALSKAAVIINVIDGAAMLEGSEFLADRVNSPMRIRDLLSRYKGSSRCLVLFVITKCEAWIKDETGIEKLRKAFEDRHKAVLNWVTVQNPNCVAMFVPVKTLGCVEFSYKEGKGETEALVFHKKTNLNFSQDNVDKPMMYAVRYCLNRSLLPIEKHFVFYGNMSSLIQY
ncbi:MAG: GTPase [Desulfobacterales bacterium]